MNKIPPAVPQKGQSYTEYKLITTLPWWVVALVNNGLVLVAEITRREVWSAQYPAKEDATDDKAPE